MKFYSLTVIAVALVASAIAIDFPDVRAMLPKKSTRGNVIGTFTPFKFPCAYTAYVDMQTDMDGKVSIANGYQCGYLGHLGAYISTTENGKTETARSILRLDVKEDGHPNSAAHFYGVTADDQKLCQLAEYFDPYESGYDQVSGFNYILNPPNGLPYDTIKENVKYRGEKCTFYSKTDNVMSTESYMEIYANEQNQIVGFKTTVNSDTEKLSVTATFKYKMEAYETEFKLDPAFVGCENFSAIYTDIPKDDNCPIKPSSASFAKPVAMIIAIVLLALISLF